MNDTQTNDPTEPGFEAPLRQALKPARRGIPPADVFWRGFRERARDLPRVAPAAAPAGRFRRPLAWTLAAAALLVLSLTLRYAILPAGTGTGPRVEVVGSPGTIHPVMIWEDAQGRGTIVWLLTPAPAPMDTNGGS